VTTVARMQGSAHVDGRDRKRALPLPRALPLALSLTLSLSLTLPLSLTLSLSLTLPERPMPVSLTLPERPMPVGGGRPGAAERPPPGARPSADTPGD
jgi:hypothetical protein